MMMNQTTMILCILGLMGLLTIPDNTTASDTFFQAGGRFGKRYNERMADIRFRDNQNIYSVGNMPPRIERGFYISRYGKRNTNSINGSGYLIICLSSYGMYCDFPKLSNSLRCKKIRPIECSNSNYFGMTTQLKPENNNQNK